VDNTDLCAATPGCRLSFSRRRRTLRAGSRSR